MRLGVLLATTMCIYAAPMAQAQDAAQQCAVSDDANTRISACREALRQDSLDAYSQYNLGIVYYQLKEPDSAMVHWRTSATIRPEYASAHAMIANLEVDRHQTNEALAQADSAIHADPKNAMGYNAKTRVFLTTDRFADALLVARQTVVLAPNDSWSHANLAEALAGMHQLSEALAEARQGLSLNGSHGYIYGLLGHIFLMQHDADHALAATDTALAADSMILRSHIVRIQALSALHRTEEADTARARLLRLFPKEGAIVTGMSLNNRSSHASATNVATALATLDSGDNLNIRTARVNALFRAGQKKDAVLAMRDFVRRHADDAHGWMFLGYIEAMSLHYSNALADWKTAVALDSKVLDNAANYQRMRTELSQVVPEPKAATVADLDLPIPPDPAPQRSTSSPTKPVILSGPIVVPQGNNAKSPAKP
jgi:tetratricopeptide (TPR) repeat protein